MYALLGPKGEKCLAIATAAFHISRHAIVSLFSQLLLISLSALVYFTYIGWCLLQKLYTWWLAKSPKAIARKRIATAESFEEWEAGAVSLDEALGNDVWFVLLESDSFFFPLGSLLTCTFFHVQARKSPQLPL